MDTFDSDAVVKPRKSICDLSKEEIEAWAAEAVHKAQRELHAK